MIWLFGSNFLRGLPYKKKCNYRLVIYNIICIYQLNAPCSAWTERVGGQKEIASQTSKNTLHTKTNSTTRRPPASRRRTHLTTKRWNGAFVYSIWHDPPEYFLDISIRRFIVPIYQGCGSRRKLDRIWPSMNIGIIMSMMHVWFNG